MCKQLVITMTDEEKANAMRKAATADKKIDGLTRFYTAKLKKYRIAVILMMVVLIAATAWGHYRDEDAKSSALTAASAIIDKKNAEDALSNQNSVLESYHAAMIAAYGYDPINPEEGDIPSGDHESLEGGGEIK